MRTILLLGVSVFFSLNTFEAFCQTTATDFTANDCAGASHNLFSELDAGKIIVIAWVMPCGSCGAPALAAFNAVKSFDSSHPGRVSFYLVDDYANTSCATLTSWGNNNSMSSATKFSDATISMSDYGVDGMPKIVVLGGTDHAIAYNKNSGVTTSNVQSAINSLLLANNIDKLTLNTDSQTKVFPNPADKTIQVLFKEKVNEKVKFELINLDGSLVKSYENIENNGLESISLNLDETIMNGHYFLKIIRFETYEIIKISVQH